MIFSTKSHEAARRRDREKARWSEVVLLSISPSLFLRASSCDFVDEKFFFCRTISRFINCMKFTKLISLTFFLLTIFTLPTLAQNKSADSFDKGTHELGVWIGGSPSSPTIFGSATDRKLVLTGVRYGGVFAATRHLAFQFTGDFIPYAMVYQPDRVRVGKPSAQLAVRGRGSSPIGLKIIVNRAGSIKPFVNASGGFLLFERGTPVEVLGATRFNFTFEFGGGVMIPLGSHKALTLGYKLHHFSNARITGVNPGLDSNVFYTGFSFLR